MVRSETRAKKGQNSHIEASATDAERIVNAQIEAKPRLKAARDTLRRSTKSEDTFVEDTIRTFRQRLKDNKS